MTDPVHPNWDGIAFQAATDGSGIIITPTSAQSAPPYTYLPTEYAAAARDDLRALAGALAERDSASYFAIFLNEMCEDMDAAIRCCKA